MKPLRKYFITFRNGENYGKYAVVYAPNEDDAFKMASNEFGASNVSNVYTEFNWGYKYTEHLTFLKEINLDGYKKYLQCRSYRSRTV